MGLSSKPYLEEWPRLHGHSASTSIRRQLSCCLWKDDRNKIIGFSDLHEEDEETLVVESEFIFKSILSGGRTAIRVKSPENYSTDLPWANLVCPDCGKSKPVLVYYGSWKCRTCSKLPYRSQRIGSLAAAWEKVDELEARAGGRRPKGMHRNSVKALRAELRELKAKLGDERVEASRAYDRIITAEWVRSGADLAAIRKMNGEEERPPVVNGDVGRWPKPKRATSFSPEALDITSGD